MIRAVVFDLWNTIVHSENGDPFQHLQRLLSPEQNRHFPELKRDAMGRPHADAQALLSVWQERLGLSSEQLQTMAEVFRTAAGDAQCFPEAVQAVSDTRKLARVALLSNTQSFDLAFLDRLALPSLISSRFLSAELGFLKPDPAAFGAVQRKLGLFPGELAMVGDSWRDDVAGALEAGWTAIWVNRKGMARPPHDPEAELVEISDLAPVPTLIDNLQAGARCSTCLG
ncbi:MAG: HAD family hydrolase [Holophaga sp.]|nr:HAD family hydrolase [Holophaga sp.]